MKIMNAAQACPRHFLPKKCLSRRSLRECTQQKRDDIVIIEVDSDDFGDVIILDVPESFHKKFKKKPIPVINIDDDDDDADNNNDDPNNDDDNKDDNKSGACDPKGDATTSNRDSPTSACRSSNSTDTDVDSVSEGKTPIKLSKSKRTYSNKNVSQNRYGLSSDYICSSDSDCSDCEFMGDSSDRRNEWWEKTCFSRPHESNRVSLESKVGTSGPSQPVHNSAEDGVAEGPKCPDQQGNLSNCVSPENKVGTSGPSQPVHNIDKDVIAEGLKCTGEQSNFSNCPINRDAYDALDDLAQKVTEGSQFSQPDYGPTERSGLSKRKRDGRSCSDPVDKVVSSVANIHAVHSAKRSVADMLETSSSTQQDGDAEMSEAFIAANSAKTEYPHLDAERNYPGSPEREQAPRKLTILSEHNFSFGHEIQGNEAMSAHDESCLIMDRQKRKETDEYKRAMEEEWASRQQELQRQAEEARRLRSRKKAEKMRIMANERRQMQRLEEVRESRRKDEENINLKDKLRSEIKNELRKLEIVCSDMSSLLRCLGIHVGGGRYPSPNEIQAAYKRACLKFHPDRFGQSDLRQQVEAEEKFKLISTMKDKFLLR